MSSFHGLREVIETQGLFSSLYTDRGSHYWYTAGGRGQGGQDSAHAGPPGLTATRDYAHSRLFPGSAGPIRTRLPHAAGSDAQRTGAGRDHRDGGSQPVSDRALPPAPTIQRFTVPAAEPGTAFIPWVGPSLAEILCVQEERVVAKDNTVRYQGLSLQIPQDPPPVPLCESHGPGPRVSGWHRWPCSMAPGVWRAITRRAS